jgi:hypothetical protein
MDLIDANELKKHALPAHRYSPEMLVIGLGHLLSAERHGGRLEKIEDLLNDIREIVSNIINQVENHQIADDLTYVEKLCSDFLDDNS